MLVHCTKKLMAELPDHQKIQNLTSSLPLAEQLPDNVIVFPGAQIQLEQNDVPNLGQWHANLVLIQNRKCIIFVHDHTRFGLIMPCVQKADFADLESLFVEGFINTLLKLDFPFAVIDAATKLLTPLRFDSNCSRSVQGTMRKMKGLIDNLLDYDQIKISELSPKAASAWLNEMPYSAKGQSDTIWPIQAMQAFIESKM
ncbi:hypothetical protein N7931_11410 [Catenovulum sp. 2E275]|uniref:DUF6933 domain-containing protein n=1 Tax=Catenovulum sp. 2E275 TaxID=2980497 RepID=UPI0021D10C76|nr:hypothetical protein [Catenovulum sp. 2E275]MCU4676238.1 hypothetical protein [Catenovulum sp. 2E275]